jgi:site-specific recombinase XerD
MERQTVNQLADGALAELEKSNYAGITIKHYGQAFARLAKYAAGTGETFLSDNLTKKYMLDVLGWETGAKGKPTAHVTHQLRAIRILRVFENNGRLPGKIANPQKPPECFRNHYDMYISECIDRNLSDRTVLDRSRDICGMLIYAKSKGLVSVDELNLGFLDEYPAVRGREAPRAMSRILSSLRCFLRHMFSNNAIPNDLSFLIPSGSRYPAKPVQKPWTSEEINDLLGSVDRSDSKGKRDYAIMILIVKYGIRAGDILDLRLTDTNWDSMTILFCQNKTSVPNALPILDDVGWALANWITNARPKQANTNHVFTRLTAPYCAMKSLGDIFKRRMAIARITRTGCGKAGPHSLRHALASHMLAGQVPLPVITSVLGHSSTTSTTVYLHSDIEGLRQCAIDCPDREDES